MKKTTEILNGLSDYLWFSSGAVGNYAHIVIYSLISAAICLLIYKRVSNQEKIKLHKKKIFGFILQTRLYQDRLGVVVSSILNILKHNLLYIRYTLSSLLVIMIPLILVSIQVNNRGGYAPLESSRSFIITARMDEAVMSESGAGALEKVECKTSAGLALETPPLRIPYENKVLWRARVKLGGKATRESIEIGLKGGRTSAAKEIATGIDGKRFSPDRIKWGQGSALMSNAEDFLPGASPVSMISVDYHRAAYPFLWWEMDALVLFFVLTLLFALVLKPFFKVAI